MINTFIANAVCMNAYYTFGNITLQRQEMDVSAFEIFDRLTKQMAAQQGITEALKETNQMAWVGYMNNIRSVATETVDSKVVFSIKMRVQVINTAK